MMDATNNRFLALDFAVRHKTRDESADNVVKSAEKYLAFLQGKPVSDSNDIFSMIANAPPAAKQRIAAAVSRVRSFPREQWASAIKEEMDKLSDIPNWTSQ